MRSLFQRGARRSQVQQRDRRAVRSRRLAAARRGLSRRRKAELAALEKIRPAASDDRRDGRPRPDGGGRARPRDRAIRGGARALPEQDAARLRLSARRCSRPAARATPRRSSSASSPRFPGNGPLHRIAARTYATLGKKHAAVPAPGRVLRVAGRSQGRGRPARARGARPVTATSISRRSSRPACARCVAS